jgi:toxin FitB
MTILDTNVASEIMRARPDPQVLRWIAGRNSEDLHITSITLAEILYGVELLPTGKRQETLRSGAEKLFQVLFAGRILSFETSAARIFSLLASSRYKQGRPISKLDAQIAAIARVHGATIATRNIADFEECGVRLVNPWEG